MLHLPQTFLRDAGIDMASFDCLPEDLQIEQLNLLLSQQNIINQQNNSSQQANQNNASQNNTGQNR